MRCPNCDHEFQPFATLPSPPPEAKLLTIQAMADCCGTSAHCLRAWDARYGFPTPAKRNPANGYRLYAPYQVDVVRAFIAAGKPFREVVNGTWTNYKCTLPITKAGA